MRSPFHRTDHLVTRDGTTGVYGITVAVDPTGMSVQALRLYERKGLLLPVRTPGGTRRYSDITRLRPSAPSSARASNSHASPAFSAWKPTTPPCTPTTLHCRN